MKLTRTIILGIAFLMPSIGATIARAEDKPAAEGAAPAAEGEKKAKKGKKAKAKEEGAKKEEAPAAGAGTPTPPPAEKK
jgi:hypothetical protein